MAINKTYELEDCNLHVKFEEKLIRVERPEELTQYLSRNIKKRSEKFVALVKADYLAHFNRPLKISDKSIVIEIWGHVFASYIAKLIKKINFKRTTQFANFIINRSDRIDCGEREIDSNRIFWDLLSSFYGIIAWFISKKH